ncbi:hypothetical protein AB0H71_13770 [Nocardia sp. NPDC050697]|uniref:hypothetical protein n=1 Tax=Nocardia sp. NPDC050697 TaxID=3155158 RepID=UPI00340E9C52
MSWLTDLMNAIKAIPRLETEMGEVANQLASVSDQLDKAKGEIVGAVEELRTQLANAGKLDHEDQAALQRVSDAAQALDDIFPDAPVPEPQPEPTPVDPAPAEPAEPAVDDHENWPAPQEPTA